MLILGVLDGKELDFYCEMPGLNLGQRNASNKLDNSYFSSVTPTKSWYQHSI
jgi:hypothetical protein